MAFLSIEGDSVAIVKESLEHELALLQSKVAYLKKEIAAFEKKYDTPSDIFLQKFDSGALGDDQDFFEWWGFLKGLSATEQKLEKARSVLSSC